MPDARSNVHGSKSHHKIILYALSTCAWCKKTRRFLEQSDFTFDYVYVDLLDGADREEVVAQVHRWNPAASFPTVVIDNTECIVGFKPARLEEVLGL